MTTRRSVTRTATTARSNPCPGCGDHVIERRTFRGDTALADAEAWRAQHGWCLECVREALARGRRLRLPPLDRPA